MGYKRSDYRGDAWSMMQNSVQNLHWALMHARDAEGYMEDSMGPDGDVAIIAYRRKLEELEQEGMAILKEEADELILDELKGFPEDEG